MSPHPGPRLLKGALVHYAAVGAQPKVIAFPYNPETLARTLLPGPPQGALGGLAAAGPANPVETITFTLALDATDPLGDGSAQAAEFGMYPALSAIELLMYPGSAAPGSLTLFVWGPNRILPVTVAGLRILERLFNPNLSPIQVSVEVTLVVVSADLAESNGALGYLQAHLATLGNLAAGTYSGSLAPLGIATL